MKQSLLLLLLHERRPDPEDTDPAMPKACASPPAFSDPSGDEWPQPRRRSASYWLPGHEHAQAVERHERKESWWARAHVRREGSITTGREFKMHKSNLDRTVPCAIP